MNTTVIPGLPLPRGPKQPGMPDRAPDPKAPSRRPNR